MRKREQFRRLLRLRALKNLKVIQADHAPMSGGMDFSAYGVKSRYESGYKAVDKLLAQESASKQSADSGPHGRDAA